MRTWTDQELIDAVKSSNKFIDVAKKLNLTNLGTNYKTIKRYITLLNIDNSHFLTRKELAQAASKLSPQMSSDELFSINNVDRQYIKKRIIKDSLIDYKCNRCGITTWEGESLSLHLDHINGINNENKSANVSSTGLNQ